MKKLNLQQVKYIFGKDWSNIENKILTNCFCDCKKAGETARIIDYDIYLDELNDLTFKGKCVDCGQEIARRIETGENPECLKRIKEI